MNTSNTSTPAAIPFENIILNGRTYRITDFLKDWNIEDDEAMLEIISPVLTKLFVPKNSEESITVDELRQNMLVNFDLGLVFDLIVRQKKHRTILALLYRPVKGDAIDENVSMEERMTDVGKLKNAHLLEGLQRFFAFVTKSRTDDSPISSAQEVEHPITEQPHSD